MNRLELITETMRVALNTLATLFPDWLRAVAEPEWYVRYAHRAELARLPKSATGQAEHAAQVGRDLLTLLAVLDDSAAPPAARDLSVVQGMRRVLERHFLIEAGQARFRSNKELERHSVQRGQEWTGYKVHLTEHQEQRRANHPRPKPWVVPRREDSTWDDDQSHLITNLETTTAEGHDAPLAEVVHQHLAQRELLPEQHWMDSGYVSAELSVRAGERHGVSVIGPPRSPYNRARTAVGRYRLRDFEIDWDQQRVRCPNHRWSVTWQPTRRTNGQASIIVCLAAATCSVCPLRADCTTAKTQPKTLPFQPQAQQQALKGQRLYQRRVGIEATVS